jgi:hypothetical protein
VQGDGNPDSPPQHAACPARTHGPSSKLVKHDSQLHLHDGAVGLLRWVAVAGEVVRLGGRRLAPISHHAATLQASKLQQSDCDRYASTSSQGETWCLREVASTSNAVPHFGRVDWGPVDTKVMEARGSRHLKGELVILIEDSCSLASNVSIRQEVQWHS